MGDYRLDGRNPLAYMGVRPLQPPELIVRNAPPGTNDGLNFVIGTIWVVQQKINPVAQSPEVYMLVNQEQNQPVWIQIFPGSATGAVESLTGDSGGAVLPTAADPANINIIGSGDITVVGNPGTNTLTITPSGDIANSFLTDAGTAVPALGVLTVEGGTGIDTSGAGSTVTIDASADVATTYTADVGTATPALNNLNVLGGTGGRNINTAAATDTINVELNNAITLGDLSTITAGNNAITLDSGDIYLAADSGVSGAAGIAKIKFLDAAGTGTADIFFYLNNVAMGVGSGNQTATPGVGIFNTGIGNFSLSSITDGTQNTGVGHSALQNCTTGQNNASFGYTAGSSITTGSHNFAMGSSTLGVTTGDFNIAIGSQSGNAYTSSESDNILINNNGVVSESNVCRIGSGTGTGQQQLNQTFIHGIRGITTGVADAVTVLVDSAGQLGTVSSSYKFKQNIKEMGKESDALYDLRPVTFEYKSHPGIKHYGLIAEEVNEQLPRLVSHDQNGQIETVKYHEIPAMLINELQKLKKRVVELENKVGQETKE